MKTKNPDWLFVAILAILATVLIVRIKIENTMLKERLQQCENYILEECPLCQGEAELVTACDYFYIECNDCELHTDYYDSKSKLVDYWNRR